MFPEDIEKRDETHAAAQPGWWNLACKKLVSVLNTGFQCGVRYCKVFVSWYRRRAAALPWKIRLRETWGDEERGGVPINNGPNRANADGVYSILAGVSLTKYRRRGPPERERGRARGELRGLARSLSLSLSSSSRFLCLSSVVVGISLARQARVREYEKRECFVHSWYRIEARKKERGNVFGFVDGQPNIPFFLSLFRLFFFSFRAPLSPHIAQKCDVTARNTDGGSMGKSSPFLYLFMYVLLAMYWHKRLAQVRAVAACIYLHLVQSPHNDSYIYFHVTGI